MAKKKCKLRKIKEYDVELVVDGNQQLYFGGERVVDTDFSTLKESEEIILPPDDGEIVVDDQTLKPQETNKTLPTIIEGEAKILDYLNGEYPQLRNKTQIAAATHLDRKTVRLFLPGLRDKGLVDVQTVRSRTHYAITQKGRDYITEYFS